MSEQFQPDRAPLPLAVLEEHQRARREAMRRGEAKGRQVDDAMVRRAALAFYKPTNRDEWVVPPVLARNMRAALEAALMVKTDVDSKEQQ